jgi:hypothetical protein
MMCLALASRCFHHILLALSLIDQVLPHAVRFDFEHDRTLRQRVWSGEGTDRKLMLDVHHQQLEPKQD